MKSRVVIVLMLCMLIVAVAGHALWPHVMDHLPEIKRALSHFKQYCAHHPWQSYAIYGAALVGILLIGLPLATAAMLFAGVIYGLWQAAAVITVSRLFAAIVAFTVTRKWLVEEPATATAPRQHAWLTRMRHYPKTGLLAARLLPVPDSMVNYGMAASPISHGHYALISLIGMLPFSIACAWLGAELGSISALIRYIR